MVRTRALAHVLWSSAAIAACGRVGFDNAARTGDARTGDAPRAADAPAASDAPAAGIVAADITAPAPMPAPCGASGTPGDVVIASTGSGDLVISAATTSGGFTLLTALPLTIPAGTIASLSVAPPASVVGTDVGGGSKIGVLTLLTNATATAQQTQLVPLTADVIGANVAITDGSGQPLSLTFASTSCPSAQTVFFHNTGNAPATVSSGAGPDFQTRGFPGALVGSDAYTSAGVEIYTTSACAASGTLAFTVTGTVCTATPVVLQASFDISGSTVCFCT